ncbi:hypothetical protein FH972_020074 [Carpinus fangiana]|uniref:F-box associated domain-containing protein n=1 Tax=Carpinus fangiana TaxID=176857 RepID=A0A5N6RVA6_9ROSI|nr:hypothetical protein FH972_020074 [Carpinus fangiana]
MEGAIGHLAVQSADGSSPSLPSPYILGPHLIALLGSDLYRVGGQTGDTDFIPWLISEVCKLNISDSPENGLGWVPVQHMIYPRSNPRTLALGDSFANFFIYDVEKCCWKTLDPACLKINSKCPLGIEGKAVAVGNYLYWITEDVHLLAFGFNLDLWLTGNFKVDPDPSDRYVQI